jgi:heme/copper-type cytochrome/quinol oxidase subunit 2
MPAISGPATAGGATTPATEVMGRPWALRRRLGLACAGLGLTLVCSFVLGAQDQLPVVASKAGFRPRVLNLRKGETVRLVLTTSDVEHCFAVDELRVEKRIVPGRATELDLTPDRAGSYRFYCCLEAGNEKLHGRLSIGE